MGYLFGLDYRCWHVVFCLSRIWKVQSIAQKLVVKIYLIDEKQTYKRPRIFKSVDF